MPPSGARRRRAEAQRLLDLLNALGSTILNPILNFGLETPLEQSVFTWTPRLRSLD
jgi:hypothetical protein